MFWQSSSVCCADALSERRRCCRSASERFRLKSRHYEEEKIQHPEAQFILRGWCSWNRIDQTVIASLRQRCLPRQRNAGEIKIRPRNLIWKGAPRQSCFRYKHYWLLCSNRTQHSTLNAHPGHSLSSLTSVVWVLPSPQSLIRTADESDLAFRSEFDRRLRAPIRDLHYSAISPSFLSNNLSNPCAMSNSLFGGGQSSLFSTNNTPSAFGNTSTTQGPSGGSLFGAQSQAQPQPAQSSILGQSQAQNNAAQNSRPSNQATQPAFFNSLLERGKKRPLSAIGQSTNFEELPSLQLGLDDIRRKARELGSGGSKEPQHGLTSKG